VSTRKRERRKEMKVRGAMTSCGRLAAAQFVGEGIYIPVRVRILYPAVVAVMTAGAV
jgi:hypothetical protein